MLYILLLIIVSVLVMIYIQMKYLIRFLLESHKKDYRDYLVFSEHEIDKAIERLQIANDDYKNCEEKYLNDHEESKEKHDGEATLKDVEKSIKNWWEAEYENDDALSSYRAMIEANIAVFTGRKTIVEAKSDFDKKFNRFRMVGLRKKVEERWKEVQKEDKKVDK